MLRTCLALALAAPTIAGDVYVDPTLGDDTNSGLTSLAPVATITRAMEIAGTGSAADPDVIRLAPGLYGAGETWPIDLGPYQQLLGSGASVTRVDAGNAARMVRVEPGSTMAPSSAVRVAGLNLRGLQSGLWFDGSATDFALLVEDCLFEEFAIGIESENSVGRLDVQRTRFDSGDAAVLLGSSFLGLGGDYRFTECDIRTVDCGIEVIEGTLGQSLLTVERCRFTGIATALRNDTVFTSTTFQVRDSLFVDCTNGAQLEGALGVIERCTFVDGITCIRILGPTSLSLEHSILADVPLPLVNVPDSQVFENLIEGGPQAGMNGNIGDAPIFENATAGDYRLAFGSPGVDVYASTATDFDGVSRAFEDGDLDTVPLADLGAFEFRSLDGPATASPGSTVDLTWRGEPGRFAWIVSSPVGAIATPLATTFGNRWLSAGSPLTSIGIVQGPTSLAVPVANDPALVGTSIPFQVLSRSTSSPTGAAWGSLVRVEIQ